MTRWDPGFYLEPDQQLLGEYPETREGTPQAEEASITAFSEAVSLKLEMLIWYNNRDLQPCGSQDTQPSRIHDADIVNTVNLITGDFVVPVAMQTVCCSYSSEFLYRLALEAARCLRLGQYSRYTEGPAEPLPTQQHVQHST